MLVCVALACSARTDIDPKPGEETEEEEDEEELPDCTPVLEPRVEDCNRAAGDAVPLARLVGDGMHLAADDEFLYYASESRVFRLSMLGGEPEALTPGNSAGQDIKYADGFVYWTEDDVLYRVPATGGEAEALLELAQGSTWAVAGDAIFSAGPYVEPSAIHRTSIATGDTTEILAVEPEQGVASIGIQGGLVLVSRANSLVSIPVDGGEPRPLHTSGGASVGPAIVHGTDIYFQGRFPISDHAYASGILRVDIDQPSGYEVFLRGWVPAFAIDDDALYADLVPEPDGSGGKTHGRLVRAPLSGKAPAHLTDTSSYCQIGCTASPNGLIVSGCNVYFTDRCTDASRPSEYRIVTTSKVP
ncbi:MAG: hypothetical protein HOV80_10830 [Polyangiaceae bacterium]|nr:hypothetical protein [Polyangiaceae bacterium]